MAKFRIDFSATALKQIKKIVKKDQIRILQRIQQLAINTKPEGCRKLTGYDDVFRIRVGTYRVLYSVDKNKITIVVLKVGHRKDIYR